MAKFTTDQANACKFIRCESITLNGTHSHWIIGVIDDSGIYYEWTNDVLPGNATVTSIKASARTTLMELDKHEPKPVIESTEKTSILGSNIG